MLHTKPQGIPLERLTDKHREVLDAVLQLKRRKEIARDLNLSVIAVDKRIASAKQILGTNTLAETAHAYRALLGYSKTIYSENQLTEGSKPGDGGARNGDPAVFALADTAFAPTPPWADERILVPRVLEGHQATLKRIVYIVGAAIGILVAALVGLSVAMTLNGVL